jgi:hypothetical protein
MKIARHVAQVKVSRKTYIVVKNVRSGNEGEEDTNINLTKTDDLKKD